MKSIHIGFCIIISISEGFCISACVLIIKSSYELEEKDTMPGFAEHFTYSLNAFTLINSTI